MEIHKDIYEKLDYFYQKNHIPNIIFHGSNGCGKKTLLMNFLNKIYDRDTKKIKNNVMIVNCSHGKGIKFIREELKLFAKMNRSIIPTKIQKYCIIECRQFDQ